MNQLNQRCKQRCCAVWTIHVTSNGIPISKFKSWDRLIFPLFISQWPNQLPKTIGHYPRALSWNFSNRLYTLLHMIKKIFTTSAMLLSYVYVTQGMVQPSQKYGLLKVCVILKNTWPFLTCTCRYHNSTYYKLNVNNKAACNFIDKRQLNWNNINNTFM